MQRGCSFPRRSRQGEAAIPAARLRERLPATLAAAEQREKTVYGETDPLEIQRVLDSFRNFVELCERKEAETRRTVPHHRELLAQRQTRPVKRSGSAGPTHPSKRFQRHHGALRLVAHLLQTQPRHSRARGFSNPALDTGKVFINHPLIVFCLTLSPKFRKPPIGMPTFSQRSRERDGHARIAD